VTRPPDEGAPIAFDGGILAGMVAATGAFLVLALAGGALPASPALQASEGADLFVAALAPPPKVVVLDTKYYGTVTIDHAAHLARRSPCASCHGPGPVHKIERFEPRVAHTRCIGCHSEQQHGPTGCRECHAIPEKQEVVAKTPGAAEGAQKTAAPATAAASAGQAEPAAVAAAPVEEISLPTRFLNVVSAGLTVLGGTDRHAASGLSFQATMREHRLLLLYSLERGMSSDHTRTLGLVGAGLLRPLPRTGLNGFATAVAGFNAYEAPLSVVPTAGVRVGVDWLGSRVSGTFALTATSDLTRHVNAFGENVGGVTFGFSACFGYQLPPL
jgi:hypothetical protein